MHSICPISFCEIDELLLYGEREKQSIYTHMWNLNKNSCSLVPSIITAIVSNIALVYCLVLILLGHKLETCCKQNKNFRQHDISVYPVALYHSCSSHYITLTCAETHLGFNVFWILPAQKESKQPVCVWVSYVCECIFHLVLKGCIIYHAEFSMC